MAPANSTLRRSVRMTNLSNLEGQGFSLPLTPPSTGGGGPAAQSTPLARPKQNCFDVPKISDPHPVHV